MSAKEPTELGPAATQGGVEVAARSPRVVPEVVPSDFEALYAEHVDLVVRSLRRLGVPATEVEDAAQEVFLVAHRRLGAFEGRSQLKTWLFGIVLRVAKDFRRRRQRKGEGEPLSEALVDGAPGPQELADRAQSLRVLDAALGELDERKRAVFVMAEIEQLTAVEVAQVLGENVNTVYSRIRAARLEVEAALRRRYGR